MKLLNCTFCHDILKLNKVWTRCSCGRASARFMAEEVVEVHGYGRIMGVDDDEYSNSLANRRSLLTISPVAEDGLRVRRIRK